MYTQSSTSVRNVKPVRRQYVEIRANRPEIGAQVIYFDGFPKREIRGTVTGLMELDGAPVQFIVRTAQGERYVYTGAVRYNWSQPPAPVLPTSAAVN